jgi:uncharacterized membrane protein YfcA
MSATSMLASVAVLSVAGFAHGVFGIGFAMIATPLLALFLDYRAAVMLAAVPLLFMASSWLVINRRSLCFRALPASLIPAIAAGSLLGVTLQIGLPERASLLLLAALLTLSVLTPWALGRWSPPGHASPRRTGALLGGLAGVTEAALNVGAPFMLIYGAVMRLSRVQQLVVLNLCFALGKAIQIGVVCLTVGPRVGVVELAVGAAASVLAFHIGNAWAERFSEARFRSMLRGFLIVMIGALIVRGVVA